MEGYDENELDDDIKELGDYKYEGREADDAPDNDKDENFFRERNQGEFDSIVKDFMEAEKRGENIRHMPKYTEEEGD